jgi:hypothetical protein
MPDAGPRRSFWTWFKSLFVDSFLPQAMRDEGHPPPSREQEELERARLRASAEEKRSRGTGR